MRRLATLALIAALPANAQHAHSGHEQALPSEAGQSAFAALAEIVGLLQADPKTDWREVDIPALREHLVDMELVTTEAKVETLPTDTGAMFHISGEGRTIAAIQAMALVHPPFVEAETGWTIEASATEDGAIWQVSGDAEKIRALGVHGILTIGAHHQAHHLAIASGQPPH